MDNTTKKNSDNIFSEKKIIADLELHKKNENCSLILISGYKSVGKTLTLVNIATSIEALEKETTVGVITLDITPQIWKEKIAIRRADIQFKINKNKPSMINQNCIFDNKSTANSVKKILLNNTCNMSTSDIINLATKWIKENNIKILLIDSLDFKFQSKQTKSKCLSFFTKKLKQFSIKYNITIVFTVVAKQSTNKSISLNDIRKIGAFEKYCDVIVLIKRPHFYKTVFGETIFSVVLNKHGNKVTYTAIIQTEHQNIKFINNF